MPIKFVHTNIISINWKVLANFYIKVFDCKLVPPERNLSGKWLEKGTCVKNAKIQGVHLLLPGYGENGPTIEIFQYQYNEEKPNEAKANREGFGHIAFLVDNVEEMLYKIVKEGGKKLGEIVTKNFPGKRLTFTYALDPENNIIEIQNWQLIDK